jgi:hypothetical protein
LKKEKSGKKGFCCCRGRGNEEMIKTNPPIPADTIEKRERKQKMVRTGR